MILLSACGADPSDVASTPAATDGAQADEADEAEPEEITLRVGTQGTLEAIGAELVETFKEHVEDASQGRITVQHHHSAALGPEPEMLTQVVDGSLDMALLGSGVVGAVAPTTNITELPYMWNSQQELIDIVFEGPINDAIGEQLEDAGLKLLGWGSWGPRDLFTTRPISSADDLAGMRIRVVENPLYVSTLESFGAQPIGIPWTEVYTAFQQGIVEGLDTNAFGVVDASLYEVTDYVVPSEHIFTATIFIVNLDTWDKLNADAHALLEEATTAGMEANYDRATAARENAFERLEAEGLEVLEIDTSPLREAAILVQDEFASREGFTDILEQARELQAGRDGS